MDYISNGPQVKNMSSQSMPIGHTADARSRILDRHQYRDCCAHITGMCIVGNRSTRKRVYDYIKVAKRWTSSSACSAIDLESKYRLIARAYRSVINICKCISTIRVHAIRPSMREAQNAWCYGTEYGIWGALEDPMTCGRPRGDRGSIAWYQNNEFRWRRPPGECQASAGGDIPHFSPWRETQHFNAKNSTHFLYFFAFFKLRVQKIGFSCQKKFTFNFNV